MSNFLKNSICDSVPSLKDKDIESESEITCNIHCTVMAAFLHVLKNVHVHVHVCITVRQNKNGIINNNTCMHVHVRVSVSAL